MRRTVGDARDAPPFRVLGEGARLYVPVEPPPTLAPEPYKIATSSSSSNRTRRKSSFVIIAETRPATPSSRSPSPNVHTGRASPFRGRGFKGPLPHAQSRPQTPEGKDAPRPPRIDRRLSTSQQNSPKRSLIPQPARRRSVSLSKTENGRVSPKHGRRAPTKNYLEVTHVAPGRRASLKVPGLSPIQGTPTKPQDKKNAQIAQNALSKRSSPMKIRRNSIAPPPKGPNGPRTGLTVRTKPPSKPVKSKTMEPPTSPSKIPVKKGPEVKQAQKGPQLSQNSRNGSLAKLNVPKSGEKVEKSSGDKANEKGDPKTSAANSGGSATGQQNSSKNNGGKAHPSTTSGDSSVSPDAGVKDKETSSKVTEHRDDELSLMDLLKQSSGASGTSSVVNTTTVTAAQPLKIDAVPPVDGEVHREREPEVKRRNVDSGRRNGAARPTAINLPSPGPGSTTSFALTGGPGKIEDVGYVASVEGITEGNTATTRGQHQKISSAAPNGRDSNVNGERHTATAHNGGKHASNETTNPNQTSHSAGQSNNSVHSFQPTGSGQHRINVDDKNRNKPDDGFHNAHHSHAVKIDKDDTVTDSANHSEAKSDSAEGRSTLKSSTSTVQSDDRGKVGMTPVNVTPANGSYGSSALVAGVRRLDDQIIGSAASLKSTGLSTGSSDTGVSVNTVRGVSSAREKRGMHMVKHPQGIETLSGNVVHLEQNGEPMLPGIRPSDRQNVDLEQGLTPDSVDPESRWKRILNRCCGCCKCNCSCCTEGRTMRCLACRRNLKPQINQTTVVQETRKEPGGCLSKLRASSKCCSLPSWKGCSRGSRVAPSEDGGCCPPERRCGAVFQRLWSRCTCRNQDAPQQMRNIQAKQSLTSVAAPVLPEEPKSKIPEVLVEHNAPMRGAIPCLPIPLAWFCLVWNVLIPGSGTFWSGLFNLCVGQPRFSAVATPRARLGALLVNTIVGVGQAFTVLFCLVGWGWSIWWGVMMVRLARKYKRYRDSEAANNDVEARAAGDASTAPPGVPSQTLRGFERAR